MLQFQPRQIDLRVLCQSLADDARTQQPQVRCALSSSFADALASAMFDDKLLRHVLGVLLSNATQYWPCGGTVLFRVFVLDGRTVFAVSDQGIGIPAAKIQRRFESFHRASKRGEIQSMGLGLAIHKNAVDLDGGDIAISSVPCEGTRFTVTI